MRTPKHFITSAIKTSANKLIFFFKYFFFSKNIIFKTNVFNIGKFSKIYVDRDSKIIIEDQINIESFVILRAVNNATIHLGKRVFIGDYSTIRATDFAKVIIGNDTMIAQGVKLISTNHAYHKKDVLIKNQHIIEDKKGIVLGEDCWVGGGVIILPGVSIGNGVVIGGNSVVTKDIPDYAVVVGNPARIILYRQ